MSFSAIKNFVQKYKTELVFVALFFILPLISFWRNFDFSGLNRTYFDVDFLGFYYPDFAMGSNLLHHGANLLWDPYNLLGIPLLGGADRLGLFYPLKAVFYLISVLIHPSARLYLLTYFSLFQMSLAGLFTYIFVRKALRLDKTASFVAGLVYMFSGSFIIWIFLPNHFSGPALLPLILYLIFLAVEKKQYKCAVGAGICLSMTLLSGYAPTFIYNNMFIVLYLGYLAYGKNFTKEAVVRCLLYLLAINIVAVSLSAVVLVPNYVNASMSNRQKYDLFGSAYFSYTPNHILYMFFPYIYHEINDPATYQYNYIGIASLVLVYLALRQNRNKDVLFFAFGVFLFFLFSAGEVTFMHSVAYKLVPQYASFRRPEFIQYIVSFCLAILTAFGLDHLVKGFKLTDKVKKELWMYSLMVAFFFLMVTVERKNDPSADVKRVAIFTTGLFLLPTLVTFYFFEMKSAWTKAFLIFILCLDLFTFAYKDGRHNSSIDPRSYNTPSELTKWLKDNTKGDLSRVFLNDLSARYNSANFGLYQVWGYYGLFPNTYGSYLSEFNTDLGNLKPESPLYDLLGVKYLATATPVDLMTVKNLTLANTYVIPKDEADKFIAPNGNMLKVGDKVYVYENMDRLPHAFFVTKTQTVSNDTEAAKSIASLNFRDVALLTNPKNPLSLTNNAQNTAVKTPVPQVKITNYEPAKVTVNVSTKQDGILVLSDSYYPEWVVSVDGVKQELLKADLELRGVAIKAGDHTVVFSYVPKSLYAGAVVSTVALVGVLAFLFLSGKNIIKLHV
jgi:hypothetical protein